MTTGERARLRPVATGQRVRVSVPATVGNVGPGFDCIGLALDLRDELTVITTDPGAGPALTVRVAGEAGQDVPRDETHLVVRTIRRTLERAGYRAPGLHLDAVNVIPHGRGLGSSAAAIVSGVLAANALLPPDARADGEETFQWCSRLEGHPDNVAPALFGSLVVTWARDDGTFGHAVVPVAPSISPVMAVPAMELSTEVSRGLLPSSVPHAHAAANAGRAALLVHAIGSAPELLAPATRDYLHQDARAGAMPASAELLRTLREQGFAAVISGAGPSVLTLAVDPVQRDAVVRAIGRHRDETADGARWTVRTPAVGREGARMEEHRGSSDISTIIW
ncbi:homoserine kinase [Tersicoccus phoenicis]|uniref:Homoserine kinase n=1 Tax=Tersicoccus phoenicis TaxID=554083 RepID=A0A1R1L977_9MICC|nr:homoserine kinase [Tersicoccus phoenicis]